MYLLRGAPRQLKFIFSGLFISCFLSKIVHGVAQDNKWQEEIKDVLTRMDDKLAKMESKVGGLNALQYAFQINNATNQLQTVELKINIFKFTLDQFKQSVQNACEGSSAVPLPQSGAADDNLNYARPFELSNALLQKIDDYGRKLILFYQELVEEEKSQKNSLSVLLETAQSGFSKLYEKVDQFTSFERQFDVLSISTRNLLPLVAELHEQRSNFASKFMEMKAKEVLDKESMVNILKELIQVLGHNISAVKMVQKNELSDYLTRALAHGKAVAKGFQKYPDLLSNVTSALEKANSLKASDIRIGYIMLQEQEKLQGIIHTMERVKKNVEYLHTRGPLALQEMEMFLAKISDILGRGEAVCGYEDQSSFELPAIKHFIGGAHPQRFNLPN